MNLRCSYCQTMFALGRETILVALEQMEAEGLHHYDAHCPKCRRANSLSHDRLAFPGWREALAEMQKQAAKAEKERAAAEAAAKAGAVKAKAPAAGKPATAAKGEAARKPAAAAKPPAKGGAAKKPAASPARPAPKTKKPASGTGTK